MIDKDGAQRARQYGGHGSFNDRLKFGTSGEEVVARLLESIGYYVTFLSRGATSIAGGPKLHGLDAVVTAPDLLAAKPGRPAKMFEAKQKTQATWHFLTKCWTSGITLAELRACQQAEALTGIRTWLALLHLGKGDRYVKGAPPPPAGLFVAPVRGLESMENHHFGRDEAMRRVFWCLDARPWCRLATLEDLGLAGEGPTP